MKQPMRLKSGGFISSGTDAGDLKILRTAKNIDDGSGMKAGGRVKAKIKKVSSMLKKASKAHAGQAKTLDAIKMKSGGKVEKPKTLKRVIKEKVKNKATDSLLRGNKNYPRKIVSDAKKLTKKEYPALYKRAAGMKEGGKTKSRVNEAGNYTKPGLRKRIFNRIKAGGKGGRPGQWSARKAQMMAKAYKKAGGGYK
mgnify:FL=1